MTTKTSKGGRGKQQELPGLTGQRGNRGKGKPGKGGGKKGRPTPIKVGGRRNLGPLAVFVAVGVIAAGLIGYAFWAQRTNQVLPWQEAAAKIQGIETFDRETLSREHVQDFQTVAYDMQPPVGGQHANYWQNCEGMVYPQPIANEHAVHSLEHGAVWITYEPSLPQEQVDQLTGLVDGNDYTMMSPFPGLDAPISVQAWGYQLKVDDPGDPRITEFIRVLRVDGAPEENVTCGGPSSITTTGTTPTVPAGGGAGM